MSLQRKRILVAKPGLDGHDAGAKIIVLALRDAGAEVIYTGLRKTPEYIARVAIDEDVDAIGLSLLSGAHMELVTETIEWLKKLDGDEIKIFIGGTIPERRSAGAARYGRDRRLHRRNETAGRPRGDRQGAVLTIRPAS